MRLVAHQPDLTPYDSYLAASRVWLANIVLWLSAVAADIKRPRLAACARALLASIAPRLRIDLRESATSVRHALFMKARAQLVFAQKRRGACTHQPHSNADIRTMLRAIIGPALGHLNAGTLQERAARLKHIVDNEAHYIAAIVARMIRLGGRYHWRRAIHIRARNSAAPREARRLLVRAADTS